MKKEKQDREAQHTNGYPNQVSMPPRSPYRSNTSAGYAEHYNAYDRQPTGAFHGGRGRGRGGAFTYHPYQRPYPAPRFRNRSATFNNADADEDSLDEPNLTSVPLGPGPTQHTEPKALCPAFTSTGT
jgi:hypothetical protein